MAAVADSAAKIEVIGLQEFFHDSMERALRKQHVEVEAQTEHYLVTVLTRFARAEEFFGQNTVCRTQRPLAILLAEALSQTDVAQHRERLQRLGDVSLLMASFFAHSFARKPVDVDYCIGMGGCAYAHLSESWRGRVRGTVFSLLFAELAAKFNRLVDVLTEVADMAKPANDVDVLRQYELWIKTGSPRARRLLEQRGIVPVSLHGSS